MRNIDEIIIHCSATREGQDFRASDIDTWHRQKGWAGIGYHYVIDLSGFVEPGRPVEQIGAHCSGHNSNSIGVCYIGGLDRNGKAADTRTENQKEALRVLVDALRNRFPSIKRVNGHRRYANKECPCFDVEKEFAI